MGERKGGAKEGKRKVGWRGLIELGVFLLSWVGDCCNFTEFP